MLPQTNDTIIHLSTVRKTLKGALEKERRSKRKKGDIRVTERDSTRYETREERM